MQLEEEKAFGCRKKTRDGMNGGTGWAEESKRLEWNPESALIE